MTTPAPDPAETTRQIEVVKAGLVSGIDEAVREVAAEIDWRLRRRTPVDTGRARGNWRVGLGEPDETVDVNEFDKSGEAGHARAVRVLRELTAGVTVYFTNGIKYIMPLEYGHSKKAPSGMMRVTAAELGFIAQMVARKLGQALHFRQAPGGEFTHE